MAYSKISKYSPKFSFSPCKKIKFEKVISSKFWFLFLELYFANLAPKLQYPKEF
jgi:hypothetical protein